jgi:hypothetical protein
MNKNNQPPVFLSFAGAIPVLWFVVPLIAAVGNRFHPIAEGGTPGDIGAGVSFLVLCFSLSALLGLIFSIISLWLRERYRSLGWLSFALYCLPGLFGSYVLIQTIVSKHP